MAELERLPRDPQAPQVSTSHHVLGPACSTSARKAVTTNRLATSTIS